MLQILTFSFHYHSKQETQVYVLRSTLPYLKTRIFSCIFCSHIIILNIHIKTKYTKNKGRYILWTLDMATFLLNGHLFYWIALYILPINTLFLFVCLLFFYFYHSAKTVISIMLSSSVQIFFFTSLFLSTLHYYTWGL